MGKKINYSNLKILKAKRLVGKTLIFRNVETSDVNFILSLRTDSEKSKYLNKTSSDVSRQVAWLENYTNKDEEAYFIIENKQK